MKNLKYYMKYIIPAVVIIAAIIFLLCLDYLNLLSKYNLSVSFWGNFLAVIFSALLTMYITTIINKSKEEKDLEYRDYELISSLVKYEVISEFNIYLITNEDIYFDKLKEKYFKNIFNKLKNNEEVDYKDAVYFNKYYFKFKNYYYIDICKYRNHYIKKYKNFLIEYKKELLAMKGLIQSKKNKDKINTYLFCLKKIEKEEVKDINKDEKDKLGTFGRHYADKYMNELKEKYTVVKGSEINGNDGKVDSEYFKLEKKGKANTIMYENEDFLYKKYKEMVLGGEKY